MLPLFAMLLFALLGIGALVVDGGLAFTEQARLDAAAEMLAREWGHTTALPDAALPQPCRNAARGSETREGCLRATRLGPLLEPLGLVLDPGDADRAAASDSPSLSLEGAVLGDRSVRLGTLETSGVLGANAGRQIRLERSTPLLLGWGAMLGRREGSEDAEITEILAARRREGMTPELSGSGLRSAGFPIEGRASIDSLGRPALRVGPLLPNRPDIAGAAGIALELDALDALATALDEGASATTLDLSAILEQGRAIVSAEGVEVGCSFDPSVSGRRLGERPTRRAALAFDPTQSVATAYLSVVESCDGPVLGFIQLALRPGPTPDRVTLARASVGAARPNASATADSPAAARQAAALFDAATPAGRARAAFVAPDAAWAPLRPRLPRLASVPMTAEPQ